jgi:Tfp pilus assembly protein PilF
MHARATSVHFAYLNNRGSEEAIILNPDLGVEMRARITKWAITLLIFVGVPFAFVWVFMPYLDISHATYLAAQGDYARAVRALDRAIRFNSGLPLAYTRRGWLYMKLGDDRKALDDFNRALSMSNSQWEPYNNRAWLEAKSGGTLHSALDDANQAVALCPTCAEPYDTRGLVELKANDPQKALGDFNRAIEIEEKYAAAYWHRSLCFEQLNQPDKARDDRRRAHEFGLTPGEEDDSSIISRETLAPRR